PRFLSSTWGRSFSWLWALWHPRSLDRSHRTWPRLLYLKTPEGKVRYLPRAALNRRPFVVKKGSVLPLPLHCIDFEQILQSGVQSVFESPSNLGFCRSCH